MKFVDEVVIYVRSGKGGDGSGSFLRAKYQPLGGPDGGDGGRGGDIIIVADQQHGTLLDLQFNQHHRAQHGQDGRGRHEYGRGGKDKEIRVPVGTIVSDADTGEVLVDLVADGQSIVVAPGGKGGRGNMKFKSATNRSPKQRGLGGESLERRVRLTLKLIADIGLVGFPNAGKSTLISRISAAKPRIADYPFTTLIPNLGIVRTTSDRNFCVADIPGLIEGAAEGVGLGHRFLRHVERVSALAILLDVGVDAKRHPVTDYETLIAELGRYSPELLAKPRILVLTKADLPDTEAALDDAKEIAEREGYPFFLISSVTGTGIDRLCYALQDIVDADRAARAAAAPEPEAPESSEAEPDAPEAPPEAPEAEPGAPDAS